MNILIFLFQHTFISLRQEAKNEEIFNSNKIKFYFFIIKYHLTLVLQIFQKINIFFTIIFAFFLFFHDFNFNYFFIEKSESINLLCLSVFFSVF